MTSLALVDWDEDGDLDLILGAYEGALYRCENMGSASEPKFAAVNHQVMADNKHLTIKDGLATPRVVDWNGDGLFDLLCGGSKGGVYYFQNTGTKGEPKFAAAKTLIDTTLGKAETAAPPEDATEEEMTEYRTQEFNNTMTVPSVDGKPTCPGTSFHLEAVDYDQDGDLDLLVGAQSYCKMKAKELTDDEKEELAELNKEMAEVQSDISDLWEGGETEEEIQEVMKSDEHRKIAERLSKVSAKLNLLEPSPRAANYIWLYRNKSGNSKTAIESD